MRLLLLTVAMTALSGFAASAEDAGDAVRPITLLTQPQAAAPQEKASVTAGSSASS